MEKKLNIIKAGLAVAIIAVVTYSLPWLKHRSDRFFLLSWTHNTYINSELNYQGLTLFMALLLLMMVKLFFQPGFRKYFSFGNINAIVEPEKMIGLRPKENEKWLRVGMTFSVIISAVTFIIIFFQALKGNIIEASNLRYLPFIPIFAAANSFTEEMITRFSIVAVLDDVMGKKHVSLVSGLLFGSVHYFGVPGGISGAMVAGFLGWFLAKSIQETRGIFWAWFIHFLQDIIIFTGLFFIRL